MMALSNTVFYKAARAAYHGLRSAAIKLWSAMPIKGNKIVFDNFVGRGYGDNPKYIADELLRQGLDVDLVWLASDLSVTVPEGVRLVKQGSLRAYYEMTTAKVWIDNVRCVYHPPKRPGQIYLQTWHGAYGPKPVEREVEDKLTPEYVRIAKEDGKMCDAIIVSCAQQAQQFGEYLWLNPDVTYLRTGLPRNDILFRQDETGAGPRRARETLGIGENHGVVLYMPTFRDDDSVAGYELDFHAVVDALERKFGKPFVMLIRFHPNARELSRTIRYDHRLINATDYPDPQELYQISDILISDYSSAPFDFMLLRKPAFICALDLEDYRGKRGLTSCFDTMPFPLSRSTRELCGQIGSFDREAYWRRINAYIAENEFYDRGDAAYRVVQWLKQQMGL